MTAITLDWIRARCVVTDDGCWLWQLLTKGGRAIANVDGREIRPHRVALELNGRPVSAAHIVLARCAEPSCCNPEHQRVVTRAGYMRAQKRGAMRGANARTTAVVTAKARARSPLAPVIDTIKTRLAAGERVADLAREFGVSPSTLYYVRQGRTWRSPSPFAGLADLGSAR